MLSEFLEYIHKEKLFSPKTPCLLAFSGGLDSVVLSDLCSRASIPYALAHCNFELRGEESEGDAHFAQSWAARQEVPFFYKRFPTPQLVSQYKGSGQMLARELRYTWFEQILQDFPYQRVLTAHHQGDVLETLLLNLSRGTGLAGLCGIPPRNQAIARPLLFANREQILAYAQGRGLPWREDSSNQSLKYRRNLIRHKIYPVLKTINPQIEESIRRSTEKLRAVRSILEEQVQVWKGAYLSTYVGGVEVSFELSQEAHPVYCLFELIQGYQFDYSQAQSIWDNRHGRVGTQYLSSTHCLVKDRKAWIITPLAPGEKPTFWVEKGQTSLEASHLPFSLSFAKKSRDPTGAFPKDPWQAWVDWDLLDFPLQLRVWQEGDRFQPLGLNFHKKVSDFLVDEKIPRNIKSRVWVLLSGNKIVWIVGYRLDNRFKIREKTQYVLELTGLPT